MTTNAPYARELERKAIAEALAALVERKQKLGSIVFDPGSRVQQLRSLAALVAEFTDWNGEEVLELAIAGLEETNDSFSMDKVRMVLVETIVHNNEETAKQADRESSAYASDEPENYSDADSGL